MIELALCILGTYAIVILIAEYDGAFNLLQKIRDRGKVFECAVCLSVWVAVPFAFFLGDGIVGYLAILGGSMILARNT